MTHHRRPHATTCRSGWPDLAAGVAAGRLAVAADRLRARRDDHARATGSSGRIGRRVLGRRGAAGRHGRRRRRPAGGLADAGVLLLRPAGDRGRRRSPGSSTTWRWRSARRRPTGCVPFCQVPLQDPDAACAELDRCLAAGHAGVEIGNHVGDRDLDDAGIVTFLQHCAERGRPGASCTRGTCRPSPRLDRWMAQWLTGMPAETHLSIAGDDPRRRLRPRRPSRCGSASPTAAARSRSGSAGSRTPGTAAATSSPPSEQPPSALPGPVPRRLGRLRRPTRCGCSSTRSAPTG